MAPMPYRDPGCVASGARTRVLGDAAVALWMTDLNWAVVAKYVLYGAEYLRAFLSAGVPARLVMLDAWQRRWELIVARVSA